MHKLATLTIRADHFSTVAAWLSQLSDALETQQEPERKLVADYNELLAFLLKYDPETGAELAQASSIPSLKQLASSLKVDTGIETGA